MRTIKRSRESSRPGSFSNDNRGKQMKKAALLVLVLAFGASIASAETVKQVGADMGNFLSREAKRSESTCFVSSATFATIFLGVVVPSDRNLR